MQILCIPRSGLKLRKNSNIGSVGDFNAILTAHFTEGTEAWQQLWGEGKKTGNLGGRWILCIDDANQHWKSWRLQFNVMEILPRPSSAPPPLETFDSNRLNPGIQHKPLYFDQCFTSLVFCYLLNEFNFIIYYGKVWFSIFCIWCCSKTVSIVSDASDVSMQRGRFDHFPLIDILV